ncbi:MAG: DNA polymerase I [Bacteroidales bacterium]|nr:DNA polymerase I [Bacteroidales bacterium]
MDAEKKLFLLDAYALIYRAYYAFMKNPRMNSKGQNTSAIFGFVNTLEDLIKRENPSHIAVGFDPSGPTFRHEAYEKYKSQREETPEDIRKAVPYIKKIIEGYHIPILEVPGFEADDVIGTIAWKAEKAGFTVYMMTPDKDYGQLVKEKVLMYKPKYGSNDCEVLGPEEIKTKYGLTDTRQMIDYLGLMGDSSDNIPGCPGVGEVTAKKLISEFGSIENLLQNTDQLKGSLKDKIVNNKDQILFSQFLATIRTDVPIEFEEEKLVRESVNEKALGEIFEELEFRSMLNRIKSSPATISSKPISEEPKKTRKKQTEEHGQISLWDSQEDSGEEKATAPGEKKQSSLFDQENGVENEKFEADGQGEFVHSILKSLKTEPHSYYLLDNESKMEDFLSKIAVQDFFCFDTETTGLDAMTAELVGMSFSWIKNEAWYIPFPSEQNLCEEKLQDLKNVLENPSVLKIGQNLKYDIVVLKKYGINVCGPIFDTMVAHYLLQPELRHNMDYLAEIYLNYRTVHIEELIGPKGKNQKSMRDVPPGQVCPYAAEDADITLQLKDILEPEIKKNNLDFLCYEVEMPLVLVLAEMEATGVSIDRESLKQASIIMTENLNKLEQDIQTMAGMAFNVNSPKQIGEVLFDKLEIGGKAKKTKTGQFSTSEDVLENLKSKHPIIEKILEQRGLKKLLSTYIDALPELINPQTGKIHTSFNQTVTATGRLSSSNPNLQNIPIREAMGREIRRTFSAGPGEVFFSADYSQIELRLMAHLSKDPSMIEAFRSGQDIHAATAAKIYHIPLEEVTSDMRRKAKTANFGIIYGISVFGLAERMGVPRSEAKELIDGYFETYPQVKAYMDNAILEAGENGWVETIYHRKRFLPDIHSHNANVRGYAERNAINAPIQGTAADIIKVAMVQIQRAIYEKGLKTRMILQVHDELNFIVPENELEEVRKLVTREMEMAVNLEVPLKADTGFGKNWLEAHS